MMTLRTQIHADLVTLQSTLKVEMPSMSKEFGDELASLRMNLGLWIGLLRSGIHQDLQNLGETNQKSFDMLGKSIHQDSADLGKQLHNRPDYVAEVESR